MAARAVGDHAWRRRVLGRGAAPIPAPGRRYGLYMPPGSLVEPAFVRTHQTSRILLSHAHPPIDAEVPFVFDCPADAPESAALCGGCRPGAGVRVRARAGRPLRSAGVDQPPREAGARPRLRRAANDRQSRRRRWSVPRSDDPPIQARLWADPAEVPQRGAGSRSRDEAPARRTHRGDGGFDRLRRPEPFLSALPVGHRCHPRPFPADVVCFGRRRSSRRSRWRRASRPPRARPAPPRPEPTRPRARARCGRCWRGRHRRRAPPRATRCPSSHTPSQTAPLRCCERRRPSRRTARRSDETRRTRARVPSHEYHSRSRDHSCMGKARQVASSTTCSPPARAPGTRPAPPRSTPRGRQAYR